MPFKCTDVVKFTTANFRWHIGSEADWNWISWYRRYHVRRCIRLRWTRGPLGNDRHLTKWTWSGPSPAARHIRSTCSRKKAESQCRWNKKMSLDPKSYLENTWTKVLHRIKRGISIIPYTAVFSIMLNSNSVRVELGTCYPPTILSKRYL